MRKRFDTETHPGWYAFIALSVLVVFVVDLQTMVGVATWLFYLVPLGACLFVARPNTPLLVALVSTVLIVVDYFYSDPGILPWIAQLNRSFAAVVIWAFAVQTRSAILSKQALQSRDWIRSAQAALAQRVMGDHSLSALGERILSFLGEYLAAAAGALYTKENDSARCIAGYALPPERAARPAFGLNEGLVGQVLGSGKAIRIEAVPPDALDATSALGQIRPKELLVCPLTADGTPIGVVELAFLEPLHTADLELLELLGEPMGIAIRTSSLRSEREALLRATQRQAEELQAQQEELRVTNEELEQQGNVLRESQARLETQQAELEQTNSQLEDQSQLLARHNADLEAAREALLAKAEELERSNQVKSEFLANMSHELRTPLNSSLILAKLLADNADGNLTAEQVQFANSISSAGNDLLELINDILDLAKIEARQVDLKSEHVDLRRLLDSMAQTFTPMAALKNIDFAIDVAPDCPVALHTDSQRLRQILRNLLANAIKFTARGRVCLHVFVPDPHTSGSGWLAFDIEDTGVGIAPEHHEVIFQPFRQADGTTNRRFGGTGLGLSISRELASMLGGRIELRSELHVGSSFTLLLPPSTPTRDTEPQRAPAPPSRSAHRPARRAAAAPTTVTAVPTAQRADRRLLLIVEDDASFAATIAMLATSLQFESLIASTADEGIQLALRERPTAIVLDMRLPDHTGLAVLDRLKHDPSTRHIPVQVISGFDYAQTALEMGATSVIKKPVDREQLLEILTNLERRASGTSRAVLIVEDNRIQRESVERLLQSEQVRTIAVASAAEALAQLRSTTFDCMVLDLALPDASGYELLEKMATDEAYSFPPVIVYTARTLSAAEEQQLRRYSRSIIIKGARSPERLLDEVMLFLHRVETSLPAEQQRMLHVARSRDSVFEGRRILLVEDDVRNVFALTRVLEPHGVILEIARNGREALTSLERNSGIELVLMDIMMPEMDGLEAMRKVRANRTLASLPIIALTAKAMPDDRQESLDAGANDYITKPIDIEKLLSLLRIWLPPRKGPER